MTGGSLFRLLTIALLMFLLYQSSVLVHTLREMERSAPDSTPVSGLPTADVAHEGEWTTIAGSAPDFAVAVLLADGKEKDVCTVIEGRYSFTFETRTDVRTFQVQVYGDRKPVMYTRPIPVPYPLAQAAQKTALPEKPAIGPAEEPPGSEPFHDNGPEAEERSPEKVSTRSQEASAAARRKDDLSRGAPGTKTVAITFDGGSYSNAAGRILDILAEKGLKATFFLTGEFIRRYPGVTRRIADEGHEVGNHTYSHLHLTTFGKNYRQETLKGINGEVVQKELLRNEKAFEDLTGQKMVPLWRAPFGEHNEEIRQWALEAGYRHVSWTYDPETRKSLDGLDWVSDRDSSLYLSSREIVEKILSFDGETEAGLAGGIVLLHLGSERETDPFHPRLGELIDRLREKGYKVGSVSQVVEKGG